MAGESNTPATGENADGNDPSQQPDGGGQGNPEGNQPPELGEAGKKALAEERKARREAEARLKELEPMAAKARELEEASKTEAEKLTERAAAAEKRASTVEGELLRLKVAAAKGLTEAQAKRLVGTSREELEADADELLATFGSKGDGDAGSGGKKGRTPVEQLRPGSMPAPQEPSLNDQIRAAEKAGNWSEARRLKTQKLVELTTGGNS